MNLEIFSCAGGMAEGFRRAGVTFAMAVDYNADNCDSYEANHGHRPVRMDAVDLLRMVRLGWKVEVDLLVADPPCTPWSRAGKRLGTADERDMLEVTCDLIALLKPRRYLIGNVPGLEDSGNLGVVQRLIGGLAKHGYCVADFISLNASSYGVPQHRIRPFWFGHKYGPCIAWPAPTHGDPDDPTVHSPLPGMGLLPWVTCRQALGHLGPEDLGRHVRLKRENTKHRPAKGSAPAPTPGAKQRNQGAQMLEWPWDRPATTLQADPRLAAPGHHGGSFMSVPNAVLLSEKAARILQGFPEDWVIAGETKKSRHSQLGQAIPPPLAHAVAESIVRQDIRALVGDFAPKRRSR